MIQTAKIVFKILTVNIMFKKYVLAINTVVTVANNLILKACRGRVLNIHLFLTSSLPLSKDSTG